MLAFQLLPMPNRSVPSKLYLSGMQDVRLRTGIRKSQETRIPLNEAVGFASDGTYNAGTEYRDRIDLRANEIIHESSEQSENSFDRYSLPGGK
jgi:hypothetical protein